jgi:hypothetical protein
MYLFQGNYGTKGNFEVVVREGSRLVHYWRANDDSAVLPWYQSAVFGSQVSSRPAVIQSNYGSKGNFELVVREGRKLRHYWRSNDAPGRPWKKGVLFGSNVSSAPALIQSNYGELGNFEVVVKEGTKLRHYWRKNKITGHSWVKGALFGSNVSSAAVLIQSNFGYNGNLEVVVREGTRFRHYWREDDHPDKPWHKGVLFGSRAQKSPVLIQGNFGHRGNFELLGVENGKLHHYWRNNDTSGYPWNSGPVFSDHITYTPSLIQGNYGAKGNFEVFTKRGDCWVHFWRNNDRRGYPWSDEIIVHAVPPIGTAPTSSQKSTFLSYFPNLRVWNVTAPSSRTYNCISWTVGVTTDWLWPGSSVSDFDAFYASYGWTPSSNGNREYRKRKIALWAIGSACKHGSLEYTACDWHESKCGSLERIIHDKFQMEGGSYGEIIKYYEKYDPNANLDLA